MAYIGSSDEDFIEGTIHTVAEIGIENMRTKHVAEYAGFTEATMYRRFPSKEILLRESFLYVDKKISKIITQSVLIHNPGNAPSEHATFVTWRKIYRYLIDHREETIFLIRYRYSSLYTDEVRKMQQANNSRFGRAFTVFEKYYGKSVNVCKDFLVNYIFEMTLGFAEKVITGKVEDNQDTEYHSWLAVSNVASSFFQMETVKEDAN